MARTGRWDGGGRRPSQRGRQGRWCRTLQAQEKLLILEYRALEDSLSETDTHARVTLPADEHR